MKTGTKVAIGLFGVYAFGVFLSVHTGAKLKDALLWPVNRIFGSKEVGILGVEQKTIKPGLNTTAGLPPGAMNFTGASGEVAATIKPGVDAVS